MLAKTWKRTSTFQKALVLFGFIALFRFVVAFKMGLIDDEAFHWSWAKELALSYYDHPGFIAWLEALSTAVFGDTRWGVRAPAFLAYFATLAVAWRLAWELFDEWTAHFVAFMMLFTPIWGIAGYVASPEPIFMFFWVTASWVFWQGCREDDARWSVKKTWLWLGVLMGLGLNAKFPMALLAPGFGLYLLLSPGRRKDLLSPWPWLGVLIATILCLPIFVWNEKAGWPGFIYQFHDRHTGETFSAQRWLGWWATQILFLTPFAYALVVLAFFRSWFLRRDARWRFLLSLSLPTLAIFYVQPFFADYKPHWPAPAHFLMMIGAGVIWSAGLVVNDRSWIAPKSKLWTWGILAFIVPINLLVYSSLATPWVPKAFRLLNPGKEWHTNWDFSNEFTGWDELGDFVNRRQREIHAETGRRPFLAGLRYETTAQTYWGTKQKTYQMAFTRSHYTVIQNLTHDFDNMKGLDALVVTTEKYPARPIEWGRFDDCAPEELKTYRGTEHARTFTVWWCRNFQGVLK